MDADSTPRQDPARLREYVAEELRVLLARRRMSGVQLAKHIGKSHTYVWRRLNGETAFDLDDLERIGVVLGVEPADLLPVRIGRPGQPTLANLERHDRPPTKTVHHGPKGRPGTAVGHRRTRLKRSLTAEERTILATSGSTS
jgi:transcriptional regulator with XRE-family HTH domain